MVENGYVTEAEGDAAKAEPLGVRPRSTGPRIFAADYFAEEVRRAARRLYGEKTLYEGGLSVRTTLDPELQVMARAGADRRPDQIRPGAWLAWSGAHHRRSRRRTGARRSPTFRPLSDVPNGASRSCSRSTGDEAPIGLQPATRLGHAARVGAGSRDRHHPVRADEVGSPERQRAAATERPVPVGDVVYVEQADGSRAATYHAAPGARDRRRAGRHGPAHRPRAGDGRRLLLRREPVQPRDPGEAPAGLVVQAVRLFGRARQRLHAVIGGHGRADRDRPGPRHRHLAAGELRQRFSRPVDAAHRHRAVAQRHDRAARAGHGHAAASPNMPRRFGIYDNLPPVSADGARRRRDDASCAWSRPMRSSPMAAARSSRR